MTKRNSPPKKKRRKLRKLRIRIPALPKKLRRLRLRKLKLRKDLLFLLAGCVIILLAEYIPYSRENKKLEELGYSKEEIKAVREHGLLDLLVEKQWYSPLLARSIVEDTLVEDYMSLYTVMPEDAELTNQDFLLINRLMDKGYEEDQILNLIPNLYEWELTPLLVFDYQYNETLYIEDCRNNRDINSPDHFELSGTYYTHYKDALPVDHPDSTDKLVNKTYYLDENFVPKNLEEVGGYYAVPGLMLTKEAGEALDKWGEAGRNLNVTFYATSGYRAYEDQDELYVIYKAQMGQAEADSLSARPGFSEHQTGLTVDIAASNEDNVEEFKDTHAYQWTSINSPDYGWILRFPKGKEDITGYQFESWHYRYLGKELATAVQQSHLTYDEFWCLYLKPWDHAELVPTKERLTNTFYTVNTEVLETAAPAESAAPEE